jgi:hypothetical protein
MNIIITGDTTLQDIASAHVTANSAPARPRLYSLRVPRDLGAGQEGAGGAKSYNKSSGQRPFLGSGRGNMKMRGY